MRPRAVLLLLGFAVLTTGCPRQEEQVQKDLANLSAQLKQLQKSQTALQLQLEDIQDQQLLIKDQVESHKTAMLTMGEVPKELPVVKVSPAPMGVTSKSVEPFSEPVTYAELDQYGNLTSSTTASPLAASPSSQGFESSSVSMAAPMAAPSGALSPKELKAALKLYKQGLALIKKGKLADGRAKLETFISKYNEENYADNALYWIGESYYADGEYLQSISSFQEVIQKYPMGNKVPDAMLKAALCFLNLEETEQASFLLGQLMSLYPGTSAAAIAGKKLAAIEEG